MNTPLLTRKSSLGVVVDVAMSRGARGSFIATFGCGRGSYSDLDLDLDYR